MSNKLVVYITGVPRETAEEKAFADFDIFDDPERPYSTFNFTYSHTAFDRLSQLAEFNTLLHADDIKNEIRNCVRKHRRHSSRRPCQLKDIRRLSLRRRRDRDSERALEDYIRTLDLEERRLQKVNEKGGGGGGGLGVGGGGGGALEAVTPPDERDEEDVFPGYTVPKAGQDMSSLEGKTVHRYSSFL
jgi:hypothetical protein